MAVATFALFVLVPVTVYFYAFHGDWALFYTVDAQTIPSAVALLGFVAELLLVASGFGLGALALRGQHVRLAVALVVVGVLVAFAPLGLARQRLSAVGTIAQFHGGFGLVPFFRSSLFLGAIVMTAWLALGYGYLVVRLLGRPNG